LLRSDSVVCLFVVGGLFTYSTIFLVILHIYCYAFNVYAWARTRINYPFILGFSPGTELRYRQVLLLATGLSAFLLGGMNLHIALTLLINDETSPGNPSPLGIPHMIADIIPLILVLVRDGSYPKSMSSLCYDIGHYGELKLRSTALACFVQMCLGMLFLPFNLLYRSSRYFFLGCFRRLVSTPLVKV
jgi:hypothetical protein